MDPQQVFLPHGLLCALGMDPELFIEDANGQIIGAERVIPPQGLGVMAEEHKAIYTRDRQRYYQESLAKIENDLKVGSIRNPGFVLDGVQMEMHMIPDTCRASINAGIARLMHTLHAHLQTHPGTRINWGVHVEVKKHELDSLGDAAKTLGCMPSRNLHDSHATVSVDPEYRFRSAGGHIHISPHGGFDFEAPTYGNDMHKANLQKYSWLRDPRFVMVLDLLVANTCVLIDRDPGNIERRKVYGRAGEHRLPKHGLEYRTLSNFWLQDHILVSLVLGLVRTACCLMHFSHNPGAETRTSIGAEDGSDYHCVAAPTFDFVGDFLGRMDLPTAIEAINRNDPDLARVNFERVKTWVNERIGEVAEIGSYSLVGTNGVHSLASNTIEEFEFFADKGLLHWFPGDPITRWVHPADASNTWRHGWEHFVVNTLRPAIINERNTHGTA